MVKAFITDKSLTLESFKQTDDIGPFVSLLRISSFPLKSSTRDTIANLIELLHARAQRRQRGRPPSGPDIRWKIPAYVAAWQAEWLIEAWKKEHHKRRVPASLKGTLVDQAIAEVRAKLLKPDTPINRERVLALLREPKMRRL